MFVLYLYPSYQRMDQTLDLDWNLHLACDHESFRASRVFSFYPPSKNKSKRHGFKIVDDYEKCFTAEPESGIF